MLIKCPECDLQVSDKALMCPHCGYPLKNNSQKSRPRNFSRKHRRLPNGFGQISEIKGRNLRKPFRAMVSIGKTSTGRPICKPLKPDSYFATYNEAYTALLEYNRNPYDLDPAITMQQLYDEWLPKYKANVSTSKPMERAWKCCEPLYNMRVKEVRSRHLKQCVNNEEISARTKGLVKTVLNLLFDYALEYELTDQNYARNFKLDYGVVKEYHKVKNEHLAFSDEDMKTLWANCYDDTVDIILIQCYSGWRPQELCNIKLADVNLEQNIIVGGMKTDAGKNRIVPIHSRTKPLIVKRYNEAVKLNSEYLFNATNFASYNGVKSTVLTYKRYQQNFDKVCADYGLEEGHRPHDGRKHFVTMAKKYHVDEYAIKYIVGHRISDITEKTYTQRDVEWLKSEVEKIK